MNAHAGIFSRRVLIMLRLVFAENRSILNHLILNTQHKPVPALQRMGDTGVIHTELQLSIEYVDRHLYHHVEEIRDLCPHKRVRMHSEYDQPPLGNRYIPYANYCSSYFFRVSSQRTSSLTNIRHTGYLVD